MSLKESLSYLIEMRIGGE